MYHNSVLLLHNYCFICGPSSVVGIATGYGPDGPGSNPGGGEIFGTCPDRSWSPPSLLYNGYRVFPGGKERLGSDADPSALLAPWPRKSRAIPLLPLWTVRPVQSLSACTRVHFTFLLLLIYLWSFFRVSYHDLSVIRALSLSHGSLCSIYYLPLYIFRYTIFITSVVSCMIIRLELTWFICCYIFL